MIDVERECFTGIGNRLCSKEHSLCSGYVTRVDVWYIGVETLSELAICGLKDQIEQAAPTKQKPAFFAVIYNMNKVHHQEPLHSDTVSP